MLVFKSDFTVVLLRSNEVIFPKILSLMSMELRILAGREMEIDGKRFKG